MWPSGKASDSGSEDRRFESYHPSQGIIFEKRLSEASFCVYQGLKERDYGHKV